MEYEWEWYTPGPDHLPIPPPTGYRQHQGPGGIPDAQHDPVFKLRTLYHPMYRLPSQVLKSSLPALHTLSLIAAPRGSFPALLPSLCLCHLWGLEPPTFTSVFSLASSAHCHVSAETRVPTGGPSWSLQASSQGLSPDSLFYSACNCLILGVSCPRSWELL